MSPLRPLRITSHRRIVAAALVLLIVLSIAATIDFLTGGFYRLPSSYPPL